MIEYIFGDDTLTGRGVIKEKARALRANIRWVEKEDIERALATIENPKEREEIMKNPYLVASIIRQQKTVTFLSEL